MRMWLLVTVALSCATGTWAQEHTKQSLSLAAQMQQLRDRLAEQEERIQTQEAELSMLRQQMGESWMAQRRAEDVKALVAEVLADADHRASLLEESITAGHDGSSFFLADTDGDFLMRIKGMIQVRYTDSQQDDALPLGEGADAEPSGDDDRGGFGITRSRFGFFGHVFDPTITYALWTGFNCEGDATVLDATITKRFDGGWSLTGGQFKLPFQYEYLVSETRLQFIERSLVAGEFCGTYTQGMMASWQNDAARVRVSFNDGASTLNTIWHERTAEWAATGRGEVKLFGDWADYADWQGWPSQDPLLVLGAAVHYQHGEYGTTAEEADDLRWTIDGSLELSGGNLFAAVTGQHLDNGVDADRISVVVQGGLFVAEATELIARYAWSDPDTAGMADLSVVTVGVNHFFHGHGLKFTLDIGYAFDAIASIYASKPLGWREDAAGNDGQVVLRTQMQLLF